MNSKHSSKRSLGAGIEPLERRETPATLGADIVFIVDESGSMVQGGGNLIEGEWLAKVVIGDNPSSNPSTPETLFLSKGLEGTLQEFGIGDGSTSGAFNRYGLVRFGGSSTAVDLSPQDPASLMGTASEFATRIVSSFPGGSGMEDGWEAIETAIASFNFRSDAAIRFILVTDEDLQGSGSNCTNQSNGIQCLVDKVQDVIPSSLQSVSPTPEIDVIADASIASTRGELVVGAVSREEAIAIGLGQRLLIGMNDEVVTSGESILGQASSFFVSASSTGNIGPDEFGYKAQRQSPTFEDISVPANLVDPNDFVDSYAEESNINFPFYGTTRQVMLVGENGLLTFDSDTPSGFGDLNVFTHEISESTTNVQHAIAALWSNGLARDANANVYIAHKTGPERVVVQWEDFEWQNSVGQSNNQDLSFQAILYANGDIRLNYRNLPVSSDANGQPDWTVGIVGQQPGSVMMNDAEFRSPVQTLVAANRPGKFATATQEDYADLAWASGGTYWNLGIARTNTSVTSLESRKLRSTFVQETFKQVRNQLVDFNGDGTLSGDDIDAVRNAFAAAVNTQNNSNNTERFDLNSDGTIDVTDLNLLVDTIFGTLKGDANLDGKVDFPDFLELSANFGLPAGWSGGNFDGDANVTFSDFLLLSTNFGNTSVLFVGLN